LLITEENIVREKALGTIEQLMALAVRQYDKRSS